MTRNPHNDPQPGDIVGNFTVVGRRISPWLGDCVDYTYLSSGHGLVMTDGVAREITTTPRRNFVSMSIDQWRQRWNRDA